MINHESTIIQRVSLQWMQRHASAIADQVAMRISAIKVVHRVMMYASLAANPSRKAGMAA